MSECNCTPRYLVVYRESERLLADAFDQDTVKVQAWTDAIHAYGCPLAPEPTEPDEWPCA